MVWDWQDGEESFTWHPAEGSAMLRVMRLWFCSLIIIGMLSSLRAKEVRPLLDQLPQGSIQSAFQILRRDYIRREDLSFEELNRAALQGLLDRLSFGAELVEQGIEVKPVKATVHAEFLAPGIAYLRPETFTEGEGALFEKALADLVNRKAEHLILDLRADVTGSFEEAAQMLQCFVPSGEVMFKLKQFGQDRAELFVSKRDVLWKGAVLMLLDTQSGSAAETIAACLKARGSHEIVGEKTRGGTVRYADVKLDDKAALRYASAEMLLPDDASVFKKGLEPTYVKKMPARDKVKIFTDSSGKSMMPFILDKVRPRYNESALVHGANPELDDYVRRSNGQPLPGDEGQLRDLVTQRALDILTTRAFLAGAASGAESQPKTKPNE